MWLRPSARFAASTRVLEFRAELLRRWPDLTNSVEPLVYDPELEAPSDLSRFVFITMHASRGDRIQEIVELALGCGLSGYDPQASEAITP